MSHAMRQYHKLVPYQTCVVMVYTCLTSTGPGLLMGIKFVMNERFSRFSAPEPKAQAQCPSVCVSSLTFHIFNFSDETTEWNLMKLNRKANTFVHNVLCQVCVFSVRLENKDDRPGLWLVKIFSTSLVYRWKEFDQTWQETSTQRPGLSLCFTGRLEN